MVVNMEVNMGLKENQTMVKLYRKTADLLKKRRLTPRESYDEVINRLLDSNPK